MDYGVIVDADEGVAVVGCILGAIVIGLIVWTGILLLQWVISHPLLSILMVVGLVALCRAILLRRKRKAAEAHRSSKELVRDAGKNASSRQPAEVLPLEQWSDVMLCLAACDLSDPLRPRAVAELWRRGLGESVFGGQLAEVLPLNLWSEVTLRLAACDVSDPLRPQAMDELLRRGLV